MAIKSRLKKIKQGPLLVLSLVLSIVITSFLIGFAWKSHNAQTERVIVGYRDKAAYDECVKNENQFRLSIPDKLGDESQHKTKLSCKDAWCILEEVPVKQQSLSDFVLKCFVEAMRLCALIFVVGYIIPSTIVLSIQCTNIGWRRLSIVVALLPAILLAIHLADEFGYHSIGYHSNGKVFLGIILGFVGGYIGGLFCLLGSRSIFLWVKEGFEKGSVSH